MTGRGVAHRAWDSVHRGGRQRALMYTNRLTSPAGTAPCQHHIKRSFLCRIEMSGEEWVLRGGVTKTATRSLRAVAVFYLGTSSLSIDDVLCQFVNLTAWSEIHGRNRTPGGLGADEEACGRKSRNGRIDIRINLIITSSSASLNPKLAFRRCDPRS